MRRSRFVGKLWCTRLGIHSYSVVHASTKGAFEVRVGRVYVLHGEFSVFIHHNVCGEVVVYVSIMGYEAVSNAAKDALCLGCLGSYASENRSPYFKYAVR